MKPDETVIAAWPEKCSGPGWSNPIWWVLVRDRVGGIRIDSLQLEEQSDELILLHSMMANGASTARAYAEAAMRKRGDK